MTEPISARTVPSDTTRVTTRPFDQPMARSSPNSRVRSNRDSSMVLPTMTAPMRTARIVLPVAAAWRKTRSRSARPNWAAVWMVASSG